MANLGKQLDPIPDEFSSYEEAAEFWDTHDTADYPDAFEDIEVKAAFGQRFFDIQVEEELMASLRDHAQRLGIPVNRLASDLLRQQLANAA